MTPPRHSNGRAFFLGALLALLLAGFLPQVALGDDPPPITVPTPTVPTPTPDTAPKPAPAPAPRYRPTPTRPKPTRTYAPPKYTPAPSYPVVRQPARPPVRKPVPTAKRPTTPKKRPVVPIVPIPQQSTRTRDRETFRPGASERAPVRIKHPVTPRSEQGNGLTWVLPLALTLLIATALVAAARSRRLRPHLSRLTPRIRNLLESVEPIRLSFPRVLRRVTTADTRRLIPPDLLARVAPRLRERGTPARQLFYTLLSHVSPASAGRLVPQAALRRVEARLHRQTLAAANGKAVPLELREPAPEMIVAPAPQPAVARLEPIATVDDFLEPEFAAPILSPPPPPPRVAEITAPAPPMEELCEIALWRGYTKTRFYARLDVSARAEDEGSAVAESPPFRFSGNGTVDQTEAAQDAYRALVDELVARGWAACESSGPWYAARFSRPLVALG